MTKPVVVDGWTHDRETDCTVPAPRPFGELLRDSFCRHCGGPIHLVPMPEVAPFTAESIGVSRESFNRALEDADDGSIESSVSAITDRAREYDDDPDDDFPEPIDTNIEGQPEFNGSFR